MREEEEPGKTVFPRYLSIFFCGGWWKCDNLKDTMCKTPFVTLWPGSEEGVSFEKGVLSKWFHSQKQRHEHNYFWPVTPPLRDVIPRIVGLEWPDIPQRGAANVSVATPAGRLILIHLQCWEVLSFLTIQRQRCIKFRVLRAQDFYTLLALNCQKGQRLPALEVYRNQSPTCRFSL